MNLYFVLFVLNNYFYLSIYFVDAVLKHKDEPKRHEIDKAIQDWLKFAKWRGRNGNAEYEDEILNF